MYFGVWCEKKILHNVITKTAIDLERGAEKKSFFQNVLIFYAFMLTDLCCSTLRVPMAISNEITIF